jgi:hypothetical protein
MYEVKLDSSHFSGKNKKEIDFVASTWNLNFALNAAVLYWLNMNTTGFKVYERSNEFYVEFPCSDEAFTFKMLWCLK